MDKQLSEPTPLYTMERQVTDSDADFSRRQKLSSMFGMFQDIAALHAENLGASVDWLHREMNVAWILMRVRVEIDKYPMLAQDLLVESWPQAPRALYDRDYIIRDTEGNVLVRAVSTWVIMDLCTREIKRDRFIDYRGIEVKKDRAIGKGMGRLKPVGKTKLLYEKKIKFSDIDYNLHVNNAKYVDYVMDAFTFREHRKRELRALEMHYVNEIGPAELMQIKHKTLNAGTDYVEGMRKSDKALVFNALVEWDGDEDGKAAESAV